MEDKMASNDGFFKGFVLGGLIGGFVALLFAPKTGKEFREELGEESEKLISKAKKDFESATKAAAHSYEKGRDKFIENIVDSGTGREKSQSKKKSAQVSSDEEGTKTQNKQRKKTSSKK
jgi:gas vesicle protein